MNNSFNKNKFHTSGVYSPEKVRVNNYDFIVKNFLKKNEFLLIIMISFILLGLEKTSYKISSYLKDVVITTSSPVISMINKPFNLLSSAYSSAIEIINIQQENEFLREENKRLVFFYNQFLLAQEEIKQLKKSLNFAENLDFKYVTANLLINSSGIYSNNVFINTGNNNGIKKNMPIVSDTGNLIGRVLKVKNNKSQILTISDINSNIPIITSKTRTRAILTGNNSLNPTLKFLDKNHTIKPGEQVLTSGDGKIFPYGILIGSINKIEKNNITISLEENPYKIKMVKVLSFSN